MAIPVIENYTDIAATGASWNVTLPVGTIAGDLLLVIVAKDDDVVMASSHGFTEAYSIIGGDHGTWCWYKIADADDVTRTYVTFTGDNEAYVGRIYRITSFDSASPIDAVDATGATGTSSSPQAPDMSTNTDNALVFVATGMDDNDEPYSLDTGGWTQDLNTSMTTAGIVIGRKVMTTAGLTGAVDFTTNASDGWAATQVAIKPSGANDYFRTIDDDMSVADDSEPQAAATYKRTESESLGIADASQPVTLANYERTENEVLGISDAGEPTKLLALIRSIADSLGLTDASQPEVLAAYLRAVADNLGITDAMTRTQVQLRTVADSLGILDARARVSTYVRAVDESVGIADAMLGVPSVSQSWQINVTKG